MEVDDGNQTKNRSIAESHHPIRIGVTIGCMNIFAVMMTGAAHPNESKNLAIVANMVLLILSGDDGIVTRN